MRTALQTNTVSEEVGDVEPAVSLEFARNQRRFDQMPWTTFEDSYLPLEPSHRFLLAYPTKTA